MSAPILFLDTETTGLDPSDHIWECAVMWRSSLRDKLSEPIAWYVEHDLTKAEALPESFRADHDERYDPATAVHHLKLLDSLLAILGQFPTPPIVVGLNPGFDMHRLEALARMYGWSFEGRWHYVPIDVTTLAVGWLAGYRDAAGDLQPNLWMPQAPRPRWHAMEVAKLLGLDPEEYALHTALGDIELASDLWDAVMLGRRD